MNPYCWRAILLLTMAVTTPAQQLTTVLAAQRHGNTGMDVFVSATGSDRYDGTRERPWHTISKAATKAVPGTTVHVGPGTYYEALETFTSGSADARIRYVSDVKWSAKLISSRSGSSGYVWKQWGDYIDIVGFDISGNGAYGIWSRGAHDRIIGNHVHHIPAAGCTSGGGIVLGNWIRAHDTNVTNNVVHDIGPKPGTCNQSHGIYLGQPHGYVANNIVFDSAGWGIHAWHAATDLVIANNLLFGNGGWKDGSEQYSVGGGITLGAGNEPGNITTDNCLVVNNVVFRNKGIGIREYGQVGRNNRYISNLIYQNQRDQEMLFGSPTGTIIADPQLVNFKADGSGDYRPMHGSPAVGHGTPEGAPATDFNGYLRPAGKRPDIGPFESQSSAGALR